MRVCPVCRAQYPPGANFCPNDGQALEDADDQQVEDDRFVGMLLDERYKIEARIGQGGMGMVYAARHVVIDKPVAIKILRHEYCTDKGLVQRFIREARAASRIGHPNIVDVTDFGKLSDGHIYFVMEYLMGVTLAQVVRASAGVTLRRMVDLAVQMCHGLAAAHAKGIVHRDLKPENIFVVNPRGKHDDAKLDDQGKRQDLVKLLDFGIAKFNFGQKTRITRMGSVFGTPQYMSPEQAAGEDADHRGDIYALGCIFYEMVTGEVPFISDTFMGTLTKHMFEMPMPPRQIRPEVGIPSALEAVILRMLEKEPDNRFGSMKEVAQAVEDCLDAPGNVDAMMPPTDQDTHPPGPTSLDLRPRRSAENLEVVTNPHDSVVMASANGQAIPLTRRKVEPTEAVAPLSQRQGGSLGWIALAVSLIVALFVGGFLIWRNQSDNSRQHAHQTSKDAKVEANPDAGKAAVAPKSDAGHTDATIAVSVRLESTPSGAEVLLNGKVVGKTPMQLESVEGKQLSIEFRRRGYHSKEQKHRVSREKNLLSVRLRKKRRKPDVSLKDLRNPYDRKRK
jgi:serine/threonine protein kinase